MPIYWKTFLKLQKLNSFHFFCILPSVRIRLPKLFHFTQYFLCFLLLSIKSTSGKSICTKMNPKKYNFKRFEKICHFFLFFIFFVNIIQYIIWLICRLKNIQIMSKFSFYFIFNIVHSSLNSNFNNQRKTYYYFASTFQLTHWIYSIVHKIFLYFISSQIFISFSFLICHFIKTFSYPICCYILLYIYSSSSYWLYFSH